MTEATAPLDSRTFARALEVLQAEQRTLEPSARELARFRILRVVTLLLIASPAVMFLLFSRMSGRDGVVGLLAIAAFVATGFLVIAALFFFILNLPLLRKLWRMERLRRRLHLAKILEPHFRAERARKRLLFYLEVGVALLSLGLLLPVFGFLVILLVHTVIVEGVSWLLVGWCLVSAAILFSAVKLWTAADRRNGPPAKLFRAVAILMVVIVFLSLAPMGGGLGFVSVAGFLLAPVILSTVLTLVLVRQGRQRLAVIRRLQESFAAAQPDGEAGAAIPGADYALVARLERGQVMLDRQESIEQADEQGGAVALVVQRSRRFVADSADLDAISLAKIEKEIFRVTVEPEPAAATVDEGSGLYRLPVDDTPYELVYQVAREVGRVRVFGVRHASGSATAGERREE